VEVHSLDTRGTLWECDDGCQRGDTAVMAGVIPCNALTKGCDHARCFYQRDGSASRVPRRSAALSVAATKLMLETMNGIR
jgi:hypothetical protein